MDASVVDVGSMTSRRHKMQLLSSLAADATHKKDLTVCVCVCCRHGKEKKEKTKCMASASVVIQPTPPLCQLREAEFYNLIIDSNNF